MGKISACVMVRANTMDYPDLNFRRALENLKPIVDEIIVVNTRLASDPSDNIDIIAQEFDAQVYNHPWENNFSLHRMQSISYATGEWLLCFDADEAVYFNFSITDIKKYFNTLPKNVGGVRIMVQDIQNDRVAMEFPTIKIFKKGKVKYERAVHNRPIIEGKVADYGGMYIKHYGYDLSPEKIKLKRDRTIALLYKAIEDNPKDYQSFFYLNQQYSLLNDDKECIKWADKYLEHKDDLGLDFNGTIYFTVIRSLMKLQDLKKAGIYIEQAMRDLPEDLDIALVATEYGNITGNVQLTAVAASKFLETYQKMNDTSSGQISRPGKFIFTNNVESLGFCLFSLAMTRYKESIFHFNNLSNIYPNLDPMFQDRIIGYIKQGIPTGLSHMEMNFDETKFGKTVKTT